MARAPIRVTCPSCGKRYRLKTSPADEPFECACGRTLEAPEGWLSRLVGAILLGLGGAVGAVVLAAFSPLHWGNLWIPAIVGFIIGAALGERGLLLLGDAMWDRRR